MFQRVWIGLLAIGLLVGTSPAARADVNIAVGLKWVPASYTQPVGAGDSGNNPMVPAGGVPGDWYASPTGAAAALAGATSLYGWQTTSLNNYIAFFFTEQVGLQLSLDLGWAEHDTTNTTNANGVGNLTTSYFQIGIGLGAKFYLTRPAAARVSPYILINLFKYFAVVNSNDQLGTVAGAAPGPGDVASAIASFRSPIGFDVAFGAEYFFTNSFSLGAEILGLRFAHVQGSIPYGAGTAAGGIITADDNYFTFYTGVSLNYRFLATASVHLYEEDESNPRPRARPKRRPAPPPRDENNEGNEGQPPSPESVD